VVTDVSIAKVVLALAAVAACADGNNEGDREQLRAPSVAAQAPAPNLAAAARAAREEMRREGGAGRVLERSKRAHALSNALGAAAAAESKEDGSPCEKAYSSIRLVVDAMRKEMDGVDPPPERAQFLRDCALLPETVQQCILPSHREAHPGECEQALDDASRARLKAMIAGGRGMSSSVAAAR
jgi:hypothetical protein